ncbi:MAG: hypothetical protein P9M08_00050, partial [Candidatus Erginobacter occultus]|nr:hypothetical protein [Candidatus Erginobacter occultus]
MRTETRKSGGADNPAESVNGFIISDADLNTEMEAYLHALEECRFGRSPRGVFSSGAGNEMYSPAAH